ncbi:MICOS complex subunit MIC26-like [Brachionichthys hirsutus]|uniref:MICOS complex subunit MIC26-like n=1 Tax=Brachionichthys hirsutus TaxID=412623 RepID=UPI003604C5E1
MFTPHRYHVEGDMECHAGDHRPCCGQRGGEGNEDVTPSHLDVIPTHLDHLSLYSAPPQQKPCVEPEAGHLEESVASLREMAKPYTDSCQVTYNKVKPKVQGFVQVGNDTYAYLKNPPEGFYPRAGVIGFAGLLGLLLGRGSRIRRLVYPAGLVTLSGSVYYPEQAVSIARSTGECVYERAVQTSAALEKMTKA